MNVFETIVIAIVEGLTEFLPVSSTGHMIIAQNLLGVESTDFVKAFTFIIQFGAILSVLVLYWKLFIAFIPAAVFGLLFSDAIDAMLEKVEVVAVTLILGGVFMLFCDKIFNKGSEQTELTEKRALMVGLFQCISMIPGVSRSMATIVGGMSQRLTRKAAAEFSFFLAVPTMLAATVYKVYDLVKEGGMEIITDNLSTLLIGNAVAFIVALLAIKFFIGFVTKYGFKAFGWYRILVGGLILALLFTGHNLTIV